MAIDDAKQSLGREGQGGMGARPERMTNPPSKETPKDDSFFNESGLARKYSLQDGRFYDATGGLTREKRDEIADKLFPSQDSFSKRDLDYAKEQLISRGKFGQYDKLSEQDKKELKQFFGGIERFSKN